MLPRLGDNFRVECRIQAEGRTYIRQFVVDAAGSEASDLATAASRAFAIIAKDAAHTEAKDVI